MSAYARWGHYVARNSRRVMWISLILVLIGFALAPVFRANLLGIGYDTPGTESDRATDIIREQTGVAERSLLVVTSKTIAPGTPAFDVAVATATGVVTEDRRVVTAVLPVGTPGGGAVNATQRVSTATVLLKGTVGDRQEHAEQLQEELADAMPAGFTAALTGPSPLLADLIRVEEEGLLIAELVGLPIAFIVLLLALRSVVAACLPLALGLAGLGVTFGILTITLLVADWNLFVETLFAMIGLGVGIDYALLVVRRYREELADGKAPPDAIARTMETAGRTVTFSGAIVVTSMIGIAATKLPFFGEAGVAVMIVVTLMVIGALTLLPALLIRLGDRLDRLRLPEPKHREANTASRWERWAHFVMRHPWPILLVTVVLLLAAAVPALSLKTGTDLNARAMQGEPSADALAQVERAFPDSSLAPVEVLMRETTPQATAAASRVIDAEPLLSAITPVPLTEPGTTLLVSTPTVAADSIAADELVRDLRGDLARAVPAGTEVLVTGTTAELVDFTDETNEKTPFVLIFVLGLSFLLLTWVFRSPVLALKAIVLNLLSIGAAFGLTVLVFQEGLGESVLDFESLGYIQGWMPLTLFMMLFGLSMDYEVFMVTRMREEHEAGADTVDAVARGIGRTGSVVTSAAGIMIAIFGSFCLTAIPEIKQMGFGLAVAVLIDATIVRAMLVPAFMKVAGRWNWWMPKRLDRLLPRLEHG